MTTPREAVLYGLAAFAIGFAFGVLREVALVPAFGARWGAFAEFPFVTAAVFAFGAWRARRVPARPGPRLARGIGGVLVLLAIEVAFFVGALGEPAASVLASLDPRTGSLFPLGLAAMALAPLLAGRSPAAPSRP